MNPTQEVFQLLQFPDQVLLTSVLPSFNLPDLLRLCGASARLRGLCQLKEVWRIKLNDDFPEWIRFKPQNLSLRDYYLALAKSWEVPVYLGGYPAGTTRVSDLNLEFSTAQVAQMLNLNNNPSYVYITFAEENNSPILLLQYPQRNAITFAIKPEDYQRIQKVVVAA